MDAKQLAAVVVVSVCTVAVADQPGEHLDPPPVTHSKIALHVAPAADARPEAPDTLPAPPWAPKTPRPAPGAAPIATGAKANVLADAYLVQVRADLPGGLKRVDAPRLLPTPAEAVSRVKQAVNWSMDPEVVERAEELAARAQTRAELTEVIAACRVGRPGAPGAANARLSRLAAWAYNRRGELAVGAGDSEQAHADFESAIAADEECWAALHNRGVSHAEQGRLAEAIADLTRAIDLNPRFATAYRNRGEAWLEQGELEQAVFDFTAAIALGPVDPATLAARGDAHHRRGQIDLAVADYNLALSLAPDNAETLARRGDVYARVGNYAQAVEDYRASLRVDPDAAATRRSYAWLLATCPEPAYQNATEAVRQARRSVELAVERTSGVEAGDDDLALHLDTLAVSLAADGRFERAARHERYAVEVASDSLRETFARRLRAFERGEPLAAPGSDR